jgi:gliding motility-associated-like protein
LYVPTGFTPGANENNKLRPFGGLLLKSLTFMVYNRYGNLVYESHSVYTEGWDGTIQGHPQETGTYVWYLDYVTMGNYRRTSKGTSVLIR